jgi:hypothetical protein
MHIPFVYAPDPIVPTHPFGIYVPGMTPDPPRCWTLLYHAPDADEQEDLMPAETGDEALTAELHMEMLHDEVDVHVAAV